MKHGSYRIGAILALAAIAATAAWFASGLRIERDNASMQSDGARSDPAFELFQRAFDSNNELMLIITRKNLDSEGGMEELRHDIDRVKQIDGVRQVYFPSPSDASEGFVSEDGKTVGLLVTLDDELPRSERIKLLDYIQQEVPELITGEVHAVGLPLLKSSVARHIARDQRVVTPLSGLVMMIMLALLFRRVAGVVLPMLVVVLSLVSTLGLYSAFGLELNSITSLLPPVVIVLSVSVAVHIFDAWIHAVDTGQHGESAIHHAIQSVWKPCVFTALMTAVGLLSLCLSPIPAVRLFGVFAATGITFSIVYAFIIFPVALAWTPERPAPVNAGWIPHCLDALAVAPVRHPVIILLVAAVISITAAWQGSKIENNTDLIQFFKKNDPTFVAHDHANRTLGSVRSLDLLVTKTDGSEINLITDLEALRQFTEKVETIPDVVRTSSILNVIPGTQVVPANNTPSIADRFLAGDGKLMRIEIQLADVGSSAASDISERIRQEADRILGDDWEAMPTGDYYQVVRDSNHLVATLLQSFGITLIIVLISTCLLFRSIAVLLPALIPNILPIIWGAGLMGLLGIDLSTGTTMVAAVVIGLAVDDTIHYLHHFQTYRHLPVNEATMSTTRRIGRAVIVSSIVLVGGFWMGAFGSFIPTNTFALLTGCMMISALFCDLLVLPAFLNLVHAKPHPTKKPL